MERIVSSLIVFTLNILFGVAMSLLLSWPVFVLWNNCLIDAVSGVHAVTWMQAWGISMLCGFLFGSRSS